MMGQHIRDQGITMVVPVPLHPDRLRTRGYNQSAWLVEGIQQVTGLVDGSSFLKRTMAATSQTLRGRAARLRNVAGGFTLHAGPELVGQHVLLVDDVMTTGATLETCGQALLRAPQLRLSMAVAAYTEA